MTDYVTDTLRERVQELRRKREARIGQNGAAANVQEIDEAISQLQAAIAERDASTS